MPDSAVWAIEHERTADYEFELVLLEVAESISERLGELGMSRKELAERVGVSRPRITQLLSAYSNPQLKTLAHIAHALEATIAFTLSPKTVTTWVEPVEFVRHPESTPHDEARAAGNRALALAA